MREIALFSGKIYTAGTNFTRPLGVTVETNLKLCIYDTKSHCLLKRSALKAKNRLFESHSEEVKCFPKELRQIYSIFIRIVLSLALSRKIDKTSGCCFGATFVLTLTQVIIVIIAQVINNRLITIALTFAISLVEPA